MEVLLILLVLGACCALPLLLVVRGSRSNEDGRERWSGIPFSWRGNIHDGRTPSGSPDEDKRKQNEAGRRR